MQWPTAALLVLLVLASPAKAGAPSEAAAEFLSAQFEPISRYQDLSAPVRSFLSQRISEEIAPVGGEYEATDVRHEPALPSRRLIAAGLSTDLAFLWYEHGGRGHHQHFVLLGTEEDSVILKLAARGEFGDTLEQLRVAITSENFSPETSAVDQNRYW